MCIRDRRDLDRARLQLDRLALAGEVVGPLTLDLDRREARRRLLDLAGEARQKRLDLGALGCLGHVAALRRTRVGPFCEEDAVTVAELNDAAGRGDPFAMLRPVDAALGELASVAVSRDMAGRLMRGQSVILRGRDAPMAGKIFATCGGVLVAVGDVEKGELVPHRVFNLGGG